MNELTILSATFYDSLEKFRYLNTSCAKLKLPLHTFGFKEPWCWWQAKTERTLRELPKVMTPYVMVTDSGDAFLCKSEEEIMRRFREFGTYLVLGTEQDCWPHKDLASQYPEGTKRYVNAGGFMGTTDGVRQLLWDMARMDMSEEDEQFRMAHVYLKNRDKIALDTESRIFQTMSKPPSEVDACQIHFNGRVGGIDEWYGRLMR